MARYPARMRWVSFRANEFAFLSVGGQAQGIIAIGGMAHGVVAVGAFLWGGGVSSGIDAGGSGPAVGLGRGAPRSWVLISAVGIYVQAETNWCGTWETAGG